MSNIEALPTATMLLSYLILSALAYVQSCDNQNFQLDRLPNFLSCGAVGMQVGASLTKFIDKKNYRAV